MKVLDIDSVREPNIFDKIVFYIRKNHINAKQLKNSIKRLVIASQKFTYLG